MAVSELPLTHRQYAIGQYLGFAAILVAAAASALGAV
jgi:hypothetical protein